MTTRLSTLTGVRSSSTALKGSQISPERVHRHRLLLPVTSVSSFGAFASASFNPLRAQFLSLNPFPVHNHQSCRSRGFGSGFGSGSRPELEQLQSSRQVSARAASFSRGPAESEEEVFFDGGVHYGDLLVNLLFGFTLVWLPLTLTAISRGLFLRYRFTNLRVTVQSGIWGGDRKDFSYDVVKDVKIVPRFIGEWGDMAIELKDGTNVEIRCVPRFREIASYVEERAAGSRKAGSSPSPSGKGGAPRKGFS